MSKEKSRVKLRHSRYSLFDSVEHQIAPRVLLVKFFYWPFISSGLHAADPLAVVGDKGVVIHASPRALMAGIKVGDKVRTSVAVVPGLTVVPCDVVDENGLFAKIANVLEQFSPIVEIVDLGVCATNARGPSRYFGGEEKLTLEVRAAMENRIVELFPVAKESKDRSTEIFGKGSIFSFGVSVADGIFTAQIASRSSLVVPPGKSGYFLAPLSVGELPDGDIAGTLDRLGVRSLGEFVNIDFDLVLERFGSRGALLHRMAGGLDTSSLETSEVREDLSLKVELLEPLEVASAVVFACKARVEQMLEQLLEKGRLCQIMRIRLMSENGEESVRDWGVKDGFSAQLLLERIRWQLESWSTDPRLAPSAGVEIIELRPQRVVSALRVQLDLDGSERSSIAKVSQALSRVDAIVGKKASIAKIKGSRTPKGSVEMVPWQLHLFDLDEASDRKTKELPPWPGRLVGSSPAICFDPEVEVLLLTKEEVSVSVLADVTLLGEPYWMRLQGSGKKVRVLEWSSLWPMMERWWDPGHSTKVARIQMVTDGMGALLVKNTDGKWLIEGSYD